MIYSFSTIFPGISTLARFQMESSLGSLLAGFSYENLSGPSVFPLYLLLITLVSQH
jgi:hypothetical protein